MVLHINAGCHLRQSLAHLFRSGEWGLPIQLLLTDLHYTLQLKADDTQGNFLSIFAMQTLTKKLPRNHQPKPHSRPDHGTSVL